MGKIRSKNVYLFDNEQGRSSQCKRSLRKFYQGQYKIIFKYLNHDVVKMNRFPGHQMVKIINQELQNL